MPVKANQMSQADLDQLISRLPVSKDRPEDIVHMDWLWRDLLPQAQDQLHYACWHRKSTGEFWVQMRGGVAGLDVWYGPGDASVLPKPPIRPSYGRGSDAGMPMAWQVITWLALCAAVGSISFLAWYIPRDRKVLVGLLQDFGVALPAVTKIAMSIPDAIFPVAAVFASTVLIALQLKLRPRSSALLVHMLVLVGCLVGWVLYRESILQPVISLLKALQR